MDRSTLMDKIKKRRKAMRETMTTQDMDETTDTTWNGGQSYELSDMGNQDSVEMLDEVKQAETLVSDLTQRRKEKQKELSKALKYGKEDVTGQLRQAKKKSRQKAIDESQLLDDDGTIPMDDDNEETTLIESVDMTNETPRPAKRKGKGLMSTQDAVFAASTVTGSPSGVKTPRNVNASIREKLRSKVQLAREKAEEEAKEESRPGRRLRGMRDKPLLATRFDDASMMTKEDYETEAALDRSINLRGRWKKAAEKVSSTNLIPTKEEAFDFFTRNWDPEEEEELKLRSVPPEEPPEGEETEPQPGPSTATGEEGEEQETDVKEVKSTESQPEDEQKLLKEYMEDDNMGRPYVVKQADYVPYREKTKNEEEAYYIPSVLGAPIEERLASEREPRFLEEEGLYVGHRPIMAYRNEHKIENRLLKEPLAKGRKWFGEDGRVLALPDPLKEVPSRPYLMDEPDPTLAYDYKKAVVNEFDGRLIDGTQDGAGRYQLDVDINTLTFTHNHLFSREHVLAAKLTEMCNQHVEKRNNQRLQYLNDKLKALKAASAHVQEVIANLKPKTKDDVNDANTLNDMKTRLEDYKYEIRQGRKARNAEWKSEQDLIRSIIRTWKGLKELREKQTFTNTTVKLQIRKESTNKAEEELAWKQDLEEELVDLREEFQENYNKEHAKYQEQLAAFKKQKKAKKEAALRQKKRERKREREENRATTEEEDEEVLERERAEEFKDQQTLLEEELTKPTAPTKFDEAALRQQNEANMRAIRRPPGQPKLAPELIHTATITPSSQCPKIEVARREEVSKTKMFVKVLFNNKVVAKSSTRQLSQEFRVNFAQIFNILIMQWPESVKVQIFEARGLAGADMVAEVYGWIPQATMSSRTAELEDVEFSSERIMAHKHNAVGSGVPFGFLELEESMEVTTLLTSGAVTLSVAWGVDDEGNVLVPPHQTSESIFSALKTVDALSAIGASAVTDLDKLSKWMVESRLDPNDPSNADLVYMMKPMGGGSGGLHMPEYFRLEQLQEEFNMCTDEDIENSRRFKLIQYREREIPEFKNYKMIPAFDKDIPQDLFDGFEKKVKAAESVRLSDDIESHREAVTKFMQRVREQVLHRFRMAAHQKSMNDVIFEDAVPNIGALGAVFMQFGKVRRPLKPVRKERKKVSAQNLQDREVFILINIVRAFDVPIRKESVNRQDVGRQGQQGGQVRNIAGEVLVNPFIEVMFQHERMQTSVADGPNPSWNEEIRIPFRPPNDDFSSTNLQTVNDIIYLNLFDEKIVDIMEDDRQRGRNVHQRIERKWLGSIKIPFSTIYFNTMIEGTFRMDSPSVLLGYCWDTKKDRFPDTAFGTGMEVGIGKPEHTYVTLFITMEPQMNVPEALKEKFDSTEDDKLLEICMQWQAEVQNKFPKREYKTTVIDVNGKSVFITRYFKPLQPPEELLDTNLTAKAIADRIARYVSLIPFISDSVMFPGLCDIWSTCDQFLQMLSGDEEEHAVLLVNYFLHLGMPTWLMLGSAIPEGATAYVLTQDGNEFWIWNASSGERFHYRDNYCPLQSVGCVVNHENIWANIQAVEQPSRMNFTLTDTGAWKPFFGKNNRDPGLTSVQPDTLVYVPTERNYVLDLQDKIEKILRDKFMQEWRPRQITRWNRFCTQTFRTLLSKLEETHGSGVGDQHMTELNSVLGSYKLSGFPVNLPFSEIDSIVEAVYSTGVWDNDSPDVEFSLAVYIHPYPNSVLSIWVYVASLIKDR